MDYWEECVSEALDDVGIEATSVQVEEIAVWIKSAHECYGEAHGHEHIPNPLVTENTKLSDELAIEKAKVSCRECKGSGSIGEPFASWWSTSTCPKCRGEGRHTP